MTVGSDFRIPISRTACDESNNIVSTSGGCFFILSLDSNSRNPLITAQSAEYGKIIVEQTCQNAGSKLSADSIPPVRCKFGLMDFFAVLSVVIVYMVLEGVLEEGLLINYLN